MGERVGGRYSEIHLRTYTPTYRADLRILKLILNILIRLSCLGALALRRGILKFYLPHGVAKHPCVHEGEAGRHHPRAHPHAGRFERGLERELSVAGQRARVSLRPSPRHVTRHALEERCAEARRLRAPTSSSTQLPRAAPNLAVVVGSLAL